MASDPALRRYRTDAGAAAYREKYARSLVRRVSSAREIFLVRRALARFGRVTRLLDCPCGAGRLLPALRQCATDVIAADFSRAMLAVARRPEVAFAQAAAGSLPFRDDAFDVACCHRLLHHLHAAPARAALWRELARVARRGVVLSFADAATRKARRRPSRAFVCTAAELAAEAAPFGLVLARPPERLCGMVSRLAVATLRRAGR